MTPKEKAAELVKLGISYCKKCGKTTNPPRCKCNQLDATKILGPNPCGSDYEILDELTLKQELNGK